MKRPHFLLATLATSVVVLVSCGDQKTSSTSPGSPKPGVPKTLRFSAIPNQNTTDLDTKFAGVAQYLSKELGVPVAYDPSPDYKASVEKFKNGQIQLAWFGGVTGVQARAAVPGAQAIVQGKEDTAYKSYFVAHKDTGLTKSDAFPMALGGLKFAFGSETSTSGRIMPSYFITQASGKKESEFFTQPPIFTGSHDKTLEQVAAGTVQAGVCDFKVYEKLVAEKKVDPATVGVIWETPPFPDYNFTAHPDLEKDFGAGFTGKLKAALLAMGTKSPELLKVFPREALIEARNDDYKFIESVCRQVGVIR